MVTEFERERVGPEPWSILVDPAHVFPSVRFEYRSGFGLPTSVPTPPEPPLILRLPPQIYLLAASTSGYNPNPSCGWDPEYGGWLVELYEPTQTQVALDPLTQASAAAHGTPSVDSRG